MVYLTVQPTRMTQPLSSTGTRQYADLYQSIRAEHEAIMSWWITHGIDRRNGGFYGRINVHNEPVANASKGVILNARLLWAFSASAIQLPGKGYDTVARMAYEYFVSNFIDQRYGGVFWQLDSSGEPRDKSKQVYAQAFAIYALTEYYRLTSHPTALNHAKKLFSLLQSHGYDSRYGGYFEVLGPQLEGHIQ